MNCLCTILAAVLRGFNLLELFCWDSSIDNRREFLEEDFRMISEFGFNFVRLPADYRFWTHGKDWNEIDPAALVPFDKAVEYGRRYGVHVQICFHRAPGFSVNGAAKEPLDLFKDEEAQRVCEKHWRFFARRYRGVSGERLSFNLVNEPPAMDSAAYARVAKRLVKAIREEDPGRPVCSDGVDGANYPVPELVGMDGVSQAIHVYKPYSLTHYLAPWENYPATPPMWPVPADAPSGILAGPAKAAMRDSFSISGLPPGTSVKMYFERVSGKVTLDLRSGGQTLRRETLDPVPGAPGWAYVRHYPEYGLSQGTYTNTIDLAIGGGSDFEVEIVDGDWAEITCIEFSGPGGKRARLPIMRFWGKPVHSKQRFLGWDGERSFEVSDPLPRKYADDAREWLYRNVFAKWDAIASKGGLDWMAGEFGVYNKTPHDMSVRWLRDVVEMCRERDIGWALWNFRGAHGVLNSDREDMKGKYEAYQGHRLDRELMDVLQSSIGPEDWVDSFIGTRGKASCVPSASVPFGMVKPSPATRTESWETTGGYSYDDLTLLGFVQTGLCGGGCPDLGDLLIHPVSGELCDGDWRSAIDKDSERAEPGYYAVTLPGFGVKCEITATERVAFYRFTYLRDGKKHLLVDTQYGNCFPKFYSKRVLDEDVRAEDARAMTGSQHVNGGWSDRRFHWRIETDLPASATLRRPPLYGGNGGRWFRSFDIPAGGSLLVKIAFSHESAGGAAANLKAEIPGWDFDAVRSAARRKWRERLSRVEAKGGTAENRRKFYTALYRSMLLPDIASDVGKPLRFSTLSLWDTYRAQQPLLAEVAPDVVPGVVNTLLDGYDRQGFLPVWAHWEGDTQCMVGSHAVPVIADAYLRGFGGVDWEKAYSAVKDTLTKKHPGRRKEGWDVLDKYGYYPFDIVKGEGVSRTFECAYDDECAARFAEALGKKGDAEFFRRRAGAWTNVFDAASGFARGRDSRGRWRTPFDPLVCGQGDADPGDFTEGNAYAYTFHVQHDLPRLASLMGGASNLLSRVDSVFDTPGVMKGRGWMDFFENSIGQYAHGNEQLHHLPFIYAAFGEPARTAERVRTICDRLYDAGRRGYPGNEDCGQMSAWFVFAASGRYPLDPCGRPLVRFPSPLFDEVVFRK